MGGGTPANTTQTSIPWYGSKEQYGDVHNMWRDQNIDANTGRPIAYGGPNQGFTSFDPLEQRAYSESKYMTERANPYSGYAGGQAGRLFNQENPAASNVVMNTLSDQYLSQENPGMRSVMDTIGRTVSDQYKQAVGEASGGFSQRGTLGGSRNRDAQNINQEILATSLADQQGKLVYDNYNQRMAEQQAMATNVGSRGDAYNLAGADDLRFSNADRNLRMGGYQRQSVQDPNRDVSFANQQRGWDWEQGTPGREADLLAMLNRGTGGTTTVSQPGASAAQRAGQGLGMAGNAYGAFYGNRSG